MAEGKTNMFGKTYNTIGSTDSNFIIKTKGDLKVQWGNKYIDIIKNGKIASSGAAVIKAVDTIEDIKKDGIYLVGEDQVWVSVDGNNVNISQEGSNVYVSFLVEQTNTVDEKYRALTNIGFYYNTLEEAQSVISGIIYVEETQKLYIANNGQLIPYTTGELETIINEDDSVTNVFEELLIGNLHLYNKNNYGIIDSATKMQLSIKDVPYVTLEDGTINLQVSLNVPPNQYLQSQGASKDTGFRLYTDGGESTLEVDNIIWRNYPIPVTFSEMDSMIKEKKLKPKMWYNITDFQNPWEVTWKDEPMYYEDQYTDIEEKPHLCGKRNAMQLIIQAKNSNTLEQRAYSLLNPDWVIYYDPTYKGPEHTVNNNIVYGFRSRIEDGETIYLSCKGQITYLKDEFGNEGNFNFRQFMFKRSNNWRYIMDYSTEILGKFFEGTNNKFNINTVDTYIQVFKFTENKDTNGNIISYTMSNVDADKHIIQGHNLVIQVYETSIVKENSITLEKIEETKLHNITASIEGNTISGIKGLINITAEAKNNIIRNIEGDLTVQIIAKGNDISNIKDKVIIQGSEFNENKLSYFSEWLFNSSVFNNNTVNSCVGKISNQGTMINNILIRVNSLTNTNIMSNNNIDNVENLTNNGIISTNTIKEITEGLTVNSTMNNNNINTIKGLTVNGTFDSNTINYVDNLNIQADVVNNIINNFKDCNIQGAIENNSFKDLINNSFYGIIQDNEAKGNIQNSSLQAFTNNKIYKDITELDATGVIGSCIFNRTVSQLSAADLYYCTFNYITGLTLDKPVYYTTFHGSIGNISRQLTDYEWELLQDPSKKTDAYPNIRVVCVPEIIKKGMILMWYGQEPIPKGWALCDGNNGTPNLINKFIKSSDGFIVGGASIGDNLDTIEPSLTEDNKLKLTVEHLPTHRHPHLPHSHEAGSASSNYVESYSYSYTDNTGEDTETEYDTSYYNTDIYHTHTIYEETSKEDESITFDNKLFSIEPRAYKLIFIMKIDEDIISQS